jgi:3-oxoacyl-[acyl-carrier protein] reductase
MNYQLENKRALVTGGSRGIGAAIVKRLAREGAQVAFTYVTKPDQANETLSAAQSLGVKTLAIQADRSQFSRISPCPSTATTGRARRSRRVCASHSGSRG